MSFSLLFIPITVLAQSHAVKTTDQTITIVVKPNNTIIVEPQNVTKLGDVVQTLNEPHKYDIALGVVIGIVVTFVGSGLIEIIKTRQFKLNIRTLIRIELNNYNEFLKELRNNFTRGNSVFVPTGNPMIDTIKLNMSDNGKFKSSHYVNLNPETKGLAFDSDELTKIEKLYMRIHHFYAQGVAFTPTVMFSGFTFSLEKIDNLINDIDNMRKCLE